MADEINRSLTEEEGKRVDAVLANQGDSLSSLRNEANLLVNQASDQAKARLEAINNKLHEALIAAGIIQA